MRRTIVALSICLFAGQIAVALNTGKPCRNQSAWEQVGDQAISMVNWNWKPVLPGWSIQLGSEVPGYRGLASRKLRLIMVWVRPNDSPEMVAGTVVHELAHAFDWEYLTPALREEWIKTRGLPPDTPWYSPSGILQSDFLYGAGDFAEAVAWTLQGPAVGFRSCLGLQLDETEKRRVVLGCNGPPPSEAAQELVRRWLEELPKAGGK